MKASAYKYGLANGCTTPLITASADAYANASADAVFSRQIASARSSRNKSMDEKKMEEKNIVMEEKKYSVHV